MEPEKISHILKGIPPEPGVYLMKDASGEIIYIGKAASLEKRVSSYFQGKGHDAKTRVLVKNIEDIEYIVTDTEVEALLLESNLIKKHSPKYNIRLKDDKRYPYIAVTTGEAYPRVIYTRKINENKNRFFGPYTDAAAARNIVSMVNRIFKLKTCSRELPLKKHERPCLNYQIKKCSGLCTGRITAEEYRTLIDRALGFLEGDLDPVLENLNADMNRYSENREYEKAAQIRDIIFDIQHVFESQKVYMPAGLDQDYLDVTIFGSEAIVVLFEFRKGALLSRKISVFDHADYYDAGNIIRSFIIDYYSRSDIPQKIITGHSFSDREVLEQYLTGRSSKKVAILQARSTDDRGIISMIHKNIDLIHKDRQANRSMEERNEGLLYLKELLSLDTVPSMIECFDISNFQGKEAVASMVTFSDGYPEKSGYRRFKIRGYDSANDPGMIHEAVSRHVQHLINESLPLPDLIVIDGGPTQLTRALEAVHNFTGHVPVISLAKKMEEVFVDPRKEPLRIPLDSPALHILQHIRDEAHRFAITYHRTLRDRRTTASELDKVPGIGPATRKTLIEHLKSVEAVKQASVEELADIPTIGEKTARVIYEFFHEE